MRDSNKPPSGALFDPRRLWRPLLRARWRPLSRASLPIAFLAAIAPAVGPLAAGPIEIHVGGAREDAVATVDDAIDRLDDLRRAGDQSPAQIIIHGGLHPIAEPIIINTRLAGKGLEIRSVGPVPATISGAVELNGWRVQDDGVWVTTIDAVASGDWWFEQLFVGGARRPLARHPNVGWLHVVRAGPDKRTSLTFNPGDLPPRLQPAGLRIVFLHDWSSSIIDVSRIDHSASTLTFADPIGPSPPYFRIDNFEPHPRYRLEGSRQLLDEPGEWSLNRKTGQLAYMPMPGESLSDTRILAPRAHALLRIEGRPGTPVRGVSIRGIRFAYTNWNIPEHGYAAAQAAFHERRKLGSTDGGRVPAPAAISMRWAQDCTIDACIVESLGASGVWLAQGSRGCAITDCIVRDAAGNGIMIGEGQTRPVDGRPWWQAAPEQAASRNTVQNCLIERCGQRFAGSVGLWIGLAERTRVIKNEIRDLPYTGLSLGWMWNPTPTPSRNNLIERNHIHDVMQLLSDGGGIYTLGLQPGTIIRDNVIHGVPANAGRAPSNGMFLDQGTTGLLITGNVIWDTDRTPIRFHRSGRNAVRGNTFVLGDSVQIAHYNAADPNDIAYQDNRSVPSKDFSPAHARKAKARAGPTSPPGPDGTP